MRSVGVRELKNNLSRYLARVKAGEVITITERGREIARLSTLVGDDEADADGERLLEMARQGLVTLPQAGHAEVDPRPVRSTGKPVSALLLEDRR
jgi:prevent-host-death family protein